MLTKFTKMNGCGNDYIYFDCMSDADDAKAGKIINHISAISDRHFGVGGDGVVLICKSMVADAKMRMFNADGSEGRMCGNAIRCVGKYLYDKRYIKKPFVTVETLSGTKKLALILNGGECVGARVNMGMPVLAADSIPLNTALLKDHIETEKSAVLDVPQEIGENVYRITAVSMGNPHCVIFTETSVHDLPLQAIGRAFERSELFPQGVNAEFVNVVGKNRLRMRVWERGSGETLACGTGSCAAAVAAVLSGRADGGKPIVVELLGGELTIEDTPSGVLMTGNAETNFEGEIEL